MTCGWLDMRHGLINTDISKLLNAFDPLNLTISTSPSAHDLLSRFLSVLIQALPTSTILP